MDLLQCLRLYRRVYETRSFSAVTREFHLTQPMVSKRIAWLEAELGVELLRRSTRGVEATQEGQRLYAQGLSLVDDLDSMLATLRASTGVLQGMVRVGASQAFARLVLAPMLDEFADQHPQLRLNFVLSDYFMSLVDHNIDVAFRIGKLADSNLRSIRIATSRRKLYATRSYLKRFGRPQSLSDLHSHRLLFYTRLSEVPGWPLGQLESGQNLFMFRPYLECDGSELIREAMLSNVGIALLPTWMISAEHEKTVASLLEKHDPDPSPIFALTQERRELTQRQRVTIEAFRAGLSRIPSLSLRSG